MEAATRTPASLSLPWKTRIILWLLSAVTDAARRKDGTVNRRLVNFFDYRSPPTTAKPRKGVKTYNVNVDPTRNLWFRVFIPIQHAVEDLPVVVYFHGGGFVFCSSDTKVYDDLCRRFAKNLPATIVSVNYRLAPEHRYPAQHDDCFDVLKFLDENSSESISENVNISRCFLVGDSAGGNLAHHVAQRACEFNFNRLKVIGMVAIQPYFGGMERTDSEIQLEGTPLVSIKRTDWCWEAFLPAGGEGYDRDHPIINVSGANAVDISEMDFPATMVVVGGFDGLKDWEKRYYEWMKNSGKQVYLSDYPNMCHAFYLFPELPESDRLISEVRDFIHRILIEQEWNLSELESVKGIGI